jgi:hypothetical protein
MSLVLGDESVFPVPTVRSRYHKRRIGAFVTQVHEILKENGLTCEAIVRQLLQCIFLERREVSPNH